METILIVCLSIMWLVGCLGAAFVASILKQKYQKNNLPFNAENFFYTWAFCAFIIIPSVATFTVLR